MRAKNATSGTKTKSRVGRNQYVGASVADPHHFNAYTDADPDPACHFYPDPDPLFHFDPETDLDPSF
jgi:hypothetical protein